MNIHDDLAARMRRLEEARAGMTGLEALQPLLITEMAATWVEAITDSEQSEYATDSAEAILEHLVPEAEQRLSDFWGTELGRALARLGRAPVDSATEQVGPSTVAAILGMTRQRASELQKKGRLLTPAAVAEEMARRG